MKGSSMVIVSLLFCLCGCDSAVESIPEDRPLLGTTWALQWFADIRGSRTAIGSQGMLLEFRTDGTFQGRSYTIGEPDGGPGNSYGGKFRLSSDRSLTVDSVWTTLVGLPGGSRYEEYLAALSSSSGFALQGRYLSIFYERRTKVLQFIGND